MANGFGDAVLAWFEAKVETLQDGTREVVVAEEVLPRLARTFECSLDIDVQVGS